MGKKYYRQEFLEECKYIVEEKEVTRYITKDLDISSLINKSHKQEHFVFCKLLSSLDYKVFFLTTLSISYTID